MLVVVVENADGDCPPPGNGILLGNGDGPPLREDKRVDVDLPCCFLLSMLLVDVVNGRGK